MGIGRAGIVHPILHGPILRNIENRINLGGRRTSFPCTNKYAAWLNLLQRDIHVQRRWICHPVPNELQPFVVFVLAHCQCRRGLLIRSMIPAVADTTRNRVPRITSTVAVNQPNTTSTM